MDMTTVIVTLFLVLVILFKFNNIRTKGIQNFLTTKIVFLSVFATLYGVYTLFNPDFQLEEQKHIITEWITSVIQ